MAEYIEREAVLGLQHRLYHSPLSTVIELSPTYIISPDAVQRIPAADVVARDCYDRLLAENDELRKERPVVHGRWKPHSKVEPPVFHCSVCGGAALHAFGKQCKSDYCPNCGARMDGDGDVD